MSDNYSLPDEQDFYHFDEDDFDLSDIPRHDWEHEQGLLDNKYLTLIQTLPSLLANARISYFYKSFSECIEFYKKQGKLVDFIPLFSLQDSSFVAYLRGENQNPEYAVLSSYVEQLNQNLSKLDSEDWIETFVYIKEDTAHIARFFQGDGDEFIDVDQYSKFIIENYDEAIFALLEHH